MIEMHVVILPLLSMLLVILLENILPGNSIFFRILIAFTSYFAPISEMVHVMLVFLAIDTISGIWASVKYGNKFESHKLRKTVYKFIWYTIAVMLAWMLEHTFKIEWTHLASIVGGFICFVELKSIFENITKITGDPVFTRILRMLKKRGSETIDEIISDDPEPTKKTKL